MSIEIEPEPNPRRSLWTILVWTGVVTTLLWSVLFLDPIVFCFLFLPLCYYALVEMHAGDRIKQIEAERLRWVANNYLEKEAGGGGPQTGARPASEEHITDTQAAIVPGHLPVGQDSDPDELRSLSGLES